MLWAARPRQQLEAEGNPPLVAPAVAGFVHDYTESSQQGISEPHFTEEAAKAYRDMRRNQGSENSQGADGKRGEVELLVPINGTW